MKSTLPSEPEMVSAIVDTFKRATHMQLCDGAAWYPNARRIVEAIAEQFEADPHRVAHALAALSPRNPWRWNVADVYAYTMAACDGDAMPIATTFGANQRAAWAALHDGGAPWRTAALKVRAFVEAIMGDSHDTVVIDVWTTRVATRGEMEDPRTEKAYRIIADAYTEAGRRMGVTPRVVQAVTWLVAQADGMSSGRLGRHDLAFKRGTADFVHDLIAPNEPLQLTGSWAGSRAPKGPTP